MMHLFEALLALHDATGSREVRNDAKALADAIFTRLYQEQGGYLPEFYDSEWKPLIAEKRGHIDLGHQFEWAFLLSRAVEKGFPKQYLKTGRRLLDFGMKHAWDPEAGGIYSRSSYDSVVVREPKMWWQQAEHLRAVSHYAALRGRSDLWPAFDKSLDFVKRNFMDSEYGGWYFDYDPARPREEKRTHKGLPTQIGYHVVGFYAEGLRLSERKMK
jgi:mannose/cellobiose epimerase-like protein (N-acyl-D-glucosamine 2-epimerase family)